MQNDTPMMRQYKRAKAECPPGTILLFRLGDFYEIFGDDAIEAAPILDLTLTNRAGTVMCGFPYHASESNIRKLIRAGKKCALCDQIEDPRNARGLVRREISSIIEKEEEVAP